MTRHPDWQKRLTDYLRAIHQHPFEYGRFDCALFVAGAVKAMTGVDPMRGMRGYRSRSAGMRAARAKGHADHIDMTATLFPEVLPSLAGPGDIAVIDGTTGPALGIVQGAHIYVAGDAGLGLVPFTAARRAFRV